MKYYIKKNGDLVIRTIKQMNDGQPEYGYAIVDESKLMQEKDKALNIKAKRFYAQLAREIRRSKQYRSKRVKSNFWQLLKDCQQPQDYENFGSKEHHDKSYIGNKCKKMFVNKREKKQTTSGMTEYLNNR